MISLKELNPKEHETSPIIDKNLQELLKRLNIIREAFGHGMAITSGLRTLREHLGIYKETDLKRVPLRSAHLTGEAVDVLDPHGRLREWVLKHVPLLAETGLWCEDFRYTKGWVHFASKPPLSGKRFFIPMPGPCPHPEVWDGNYDKQWDTKKKYLGNASL